MPHFFGGAAMRYNDVYGSLNFPFYVLRWLNECVVAI